MPNWDLDPALFLTPQFQAQAPAEEIACVICSTPSGEGYLRTICIVDVNPTSRTYSEVIGEIALHQPGEPPCGRSRAVAADAGLTIMPRVLLAHTPEHPYGFSSSGFSLHDLSTAISIWYRDRDLAGSSPWIVRKIIEIPEETERADQLPPLLRPSAAIPPLITDLALSLDDRFLYATCWGTGYFTQFDVSDPHAPHEIASVCIGGIATRAAHPSRAGALGGGPSAVTLSRDGRRAYLTNALSPVWDTQLYPDGFQGWMVKVDIDLCGGLAFDPNFFVDFGLQRPHQVRLQGQGLE